MARFLISVLLALLLLRARAEDVECTDEAFSSSEHQVYNDNGTFRVLWTNNKWSTVQGRLTTFRTLCLDNSTDPGRPYRNASSTEGYAVRFRNRFVLSWCRVRETPCELEAKVAAWTARCEETSDRGYVFNERPYYLHLNDTQSMRRHLDMVAQEQKHNLTTEELRRYRHANASAFFMVLVKDTKFELRWCETYATPRCTTARPTTTTPAAAETTGANPTTTTTTTTTVAETTSPSPTTTTTTAAAETTSSVATHHPTPSSLGSSAKTSTSTTTGVSSGQVVVVVVAKTTERVRNGVLWSGRHHLSCLVEPWEILCIALLAATWMAVGGYCMYLCLRRRLYAEGGNGAV